MTIIRFLIDKERITTIGITSMQSLDTARLDQTRFKCKVDLPRLHNDHFF